METVMNFKKVLAVALAGCALATLGGCASMSSKGDPSAMVPTHSAPNDAVDESYVDHVNRQAQEMGVSVVWINPPTKQDH
jgi:hypothetical protein